MKKLVEDLNTVNKDIKSLSRKLERLSKKADKLLKAQAAKKAKAAPKKKAAKKPATKPAKPMAQKGAVRKGVSVKSPTEKVLKVMKSYKKGVNISRLKARTGLSDKQISNIVHRANKNGQIKRIARGVYQLA